MLDFHYSDWWADPQKQNKPAAWAKLDFDALEKQVETYTKDVMSTLKAAGATPDFVQIGNEINRRDALARRPGAGSAIDREGVRRRRAAH
ncbi:MAG: glycosyl hydrolase 53 family protein [Ignavibacteriota bacterium]